MYRYSINGRWETWRPQPDQVSTDALANWSSKTKAEVEWVSTVTRQSDNIVVHTVIPKLTCVKCHPLTDDQGNTLRYTFSDPSRVESICKGVMDDWRRRYHGYYELIEYSPRIGGYGSSYTLSIMVCYQLNQCLIQDCEGQGPNLRAAKSMAAQKLLRSGHCMVCL